MAAMYTTLLVLHFIGLALGVGTGFAQMTLGIATRDMAPPERGQFMMRAFALGKNGSIGIALLLVSGLGMMALRGFSATLQWGGGAFHAKLALVAVLVCVFGYLQVLVRRARKEGGGPTLAKLPRVGQAMLMLGIAIVICAAIAFH
jgi:uncharacterized membrane protein